MKTNNEFYKLSKIVKNMPSLNEAISFNDTLAENDYNGEDEEPIADDSLTAKHNEEELPKEDNENIIDEIRSIALNGLAKLAKDTSNPDYDTLKKIWQFCEKKNSEPKEDKVNFHDNSEM